jgi:hypothetical protein
MLTKICFRMIAHEFLFQMAEAFNYIKSQTELLVADC